MRPETKIGIFIVSLFIMAYIIYWIKTLPRQPDPWDNLSEDEKPDLESDKTNPVCGNCLTPVKPFQHYCPKCSHVTGEYTRYIPFVNIPFNFSIFASAWKNVAGKNPSILSRLVYLVFLFFIFPWVIIIGLPLLIWEWFGKSKHNV
jgi:hypothetical protein